MCSTDPSWLAAAVIRRPLYAVQPEHSVLCGVTNQHTTYYNDGMCARRQGYPRWVRTLERVVYGGTGMKPLGLAARDSLAARAMADPYPACATLRASGPVCRVGPAGWGVTHHRQVFALLRSPRLANALPVANRQVGASASALQLLLPARKT